MMMGPGLGLLNRRRRAAAASYPLLDNLVAYWNLSEASGQRNDSCTNALHLTDNNTVTSATGPDGGTAASFAAASSEYLSRASESALQAGDIDFTVAVWVRLTSINIFAPLVARDNTTSEREFLLQITTLPARYARFVIGNGASSLVGAVNATDFGALSLDTWYFVVGMHNSGADTISVYVNGIGNSAATTGTPAANNQPLKIGDAIGSLHTLDGRMAYAGFWKRSLTAAERTWLYNSGAGRNYAAVAAYTG